MNSTDFKFLNKWDLQQIFYLTKPPINVLIYFNVFSLTIRGEKYFFLINTYVCV